MVLATGAACTLILTAGAGAPAVAGATYGVLSTTAATAGTGAVVGGSAGAGAAIGAVTGAVTGGTAGASAIGAVAGSAAAVGVTSASAGGAAAVGTLAGSTAVAGATSASAGGTALGAAGLLSGPAGWLVLGYKRTPGQGCTFDCWKPVLHDKSLEPSNGKPLRDVIADSRIKDVTVSAFEDSYLPEIILENIWDEKFIIQYVLFPSDEIFLHAVRLN